MHPLSAAEDSGAQFPCFTSTKVPILTETEGGCSTGSSHTQRCALATKRATSKPPRTTTLSCAFARCYWHTPAFTTACTTAFTTALLLLYYCFTTALLQAYCRFTTALCNLKTTRCTTTPSRAFARQPHQYLISPACFVVFSTFFFGTSICACKSAAYYRLTTGLLLVYHRLTTDLLLRRCATTRI